MRRLMSAVVVAALAGLLLFAAAPATAAEPAPPPVTDIPDIPSRAVKGLTNSPMMNATLIDLWRVMSGKGTALTPMPPAPAAAPIKPITGPAALARGGGAGAAVFTAANFGWAIGSTGGLVIYAVATGTDYNTATCAQPQWYQGVTSFVTMGLAPGCNFSLIDPNSDVPSTGLTDAVIGASTLHFVGQSTSTNNNVKPYYWCYTLAGGIPAGYDVVRWHKTDNVWRAEGLGSGYEQACADRYADRHPSGLNSGGYGPNEPPRFGFRKISSGQLEGTQMQVPVSDPSRTVRCKITWEDGSTTTAIGNVYKESTGLEVSAAALGCEQAYVSKPGAGPSLLPDRIQVESDNGGSITTIADADVPSFSAPEKQSMMPNNGGNGTGLQLWKVAGTLTGSCMTWAADCAGWWAATSNGTTTGTYECRFGGIVIALVECGPYRTTFDTKTSNPTITDPSTGTQTPWSAQPSTGNSTNPGTGPGTGANPTDQCFETGWADVANPVDWVLVPVKCALVWAFVPRPAVVTAGFTNLENRWQSTAIGSLSTAVAGWSFVAPSSGGCDGINVPISQLGHGIADFRILYACSGPLQPLAVLSTLVIGIGAVLTAIAAVTGNIGGIVGQRALASGSAS